MSEVKTGLTC